MVFLIISLIIGLLAFGDMMAAGENSITAAAPGKLHKLKSDGNKRMSGTTRLDVVISRCSRATMTLWMVSGHFLKKMAELD